MSAALIFFKKFWPYILGLALLATVAYQHTRINYWSQQYELCQQTRETDKANFQAAADRAELNNLEEVRKVEQKWQLVVSEHTEKYSEDIADSNAAVVAYVDRMRQQTSAYYSAAGGGSVPDLAGPAPTLEGAGRNTLVPEADLYICADNTLKAKGWQDFYGSLQEAQDGQP